MREIKFRAWDQGDKVMIYDLNSPHLLHGVLIEDGYILQQYTGLKDCNGKEIYEADILKCTYEIPAEPACGEEEKIEVVIFDIEEAAFKFECSDYEMYWPIKKEIIGNIHENPELLEEEV